MLSLFTFSAENVASTTAYIGVIFNDIKLLFFVVVGLGLGLWIISAVIKAIRPD